jgi:hypothetical protein
VSRVWVYDPREESGTYLPMRVPTLCARALCRIRPSLDYAPNADGTETEPYPESYAELRNNAVRYRFYAYCAIGALCFFVLAGMALRHGSQTQTPTTTHALTCWEEARGDEADYYCGTVEESASRHVLRYVSIMPTNAVLTCVQSPEARSVTAMADCVQSYADEADN